MLNFSTTIGKFRAKLLDHCLKFGLDAFCGLPTPRTGICEEIGDDGTARVEDVVVIYGIQVGHSGEVRGSVGGNILPVLTDFTGDGVEGSHIFFLLVTL